MDTVWKTNGVKRVDCCPYCTLAFCSVISISTQGLITPLHYTMSGAPGSRLRHAPFDWLRLGFSAQPHPKGLPGKQEEGRPLEPETAHIIPDEIRNPPAVLYPSGGLQTKLTVVTWRNHWLVDAWAGLFVWFFSLALGELRFLLCRNLDITFSSHLKSCSIFLRYVYKVKKCHFIEYLLVLSMIFFVLYFFCKLSASLAIDHIFPRQWQVT